MLLGAVSRMSGEAGVVGEQGDLGAVVQAELGEDVETCAFTVATLMESSAAISAFVRPLGDREHHLVLARGEGGQRGAGPLVRAGLGRRRGPSAAG